ncbi:hypothetical protein [Bdellovibrio sp.]|uniref:hypothetical protein n=1 Tax=Bdellovibrio sp. TaxID=28201 RepID=UPI0032214206
MKNVKILVMMALMSIMMVGCVEAIPAVALLNKGDSGSVTAPDGGGKGDDTDKTPEPAPTPAPKLFTGNPSDEFEAATFDSSRWTAYDFNPSLPVTQTAQGIQIGENSSHSGVGAFRLKANYSTEINDLYGDSVIGELHVKMKGLIDQTGVTTYFENGKRMVAYVYLKVGSVDVMGRVDIYDTDGTTLLFHSTPLVIGDISKCREYKIIPNFGASSTAQWNVDFSDYCASTGYATYTALDHATLGGTDYIGNNNGKARMELFGNRLPVAPDSDADPFFGTTTIATFYGGNAQGAVYNVELLNWNFSVLGAKVYAE